MKLTSLGSGSSGNGFVLQTDQISLLIDCGIPARSCQAAFKELACADNLAGIVISHEHIDHVRSIDSVVRRSTACRLVTTSGTYAALRNEHKWDRRCSGERFSESGVEIEFIGVHHDAAEPCGFVINAEGTRIAVFTDLGHVTEEVIAALSSADIIVLESNYDRYMLQAGRYPAHLKRRIQGPNGHLSNDDCASALVASVSARTQAVWLAHLSHNNNETHLAVGAATEALALAGYTVPVTALPRHARAEITNVPARQLMLGF